MNSLMWFIYLANVLPGLGGAGVFLMALAAVLMFVLPREGDKIFSIEHAGPFHGIQRKGPWVLVAVGLFFSVATPSQETIYLMAGAKGAEVVASSEVGKEILMDINEVIQFQLENLKGAP